MKINGIGISIMARKKIFLGEKKTISASVSIFAPVQNVIGSGFTVAPDTYNYTLSRSHTHTHAAIHLA